MNNKCKEVKISLVIFTLILLCLFSELCTCLPESYSQARAGFNEFEGQVSAMAVAGASYRKIGDHVHAEGPAAGAGVHVGANTGYGLKASVGHVAFDDGVVGAKLGLSADTGYSVGADGVGVKLLGSGVSFGGGRVEFCFLGSCLKIG